jgi:D-alanine--poly(phosphoribitol) ligase subunit 1
LIDFINIIRENSESFPDRIAVIDKENMTTYRDFWTKVISFAQSLLNLGPIPRVVVDMPQGVDAYALIVAIIASGGTYCPMNQEAPIERKQQIIGEFQPHVVVVDTPNKRNEISGVQIKTVEDFFPKCSAWVQKMHSAEDICYVIYTSGTTGMPKGVKICRKALDKFLEWSIPTYRSGENDVWGQFSALSFDLSIVDIFTCLCSGSTLLAINDAAAKRGRPASLIESHKITVWHSIPSAVEFMILNEQAKTYDFSSVRLMSFCGEPLRIHQVEFLLRKNPEMTVFNTYGPTEGTLFCTWQELSTHNYKDYCDVTLTIGEPIPGWNLFLENCDDPNEQEVVLYGEFIGRGYLAPVSNSGFTSIEINGSPQAAFRTGDLVRTKNGHLFFSGRKDRQVKLKGYRIELDEIDFRIREYLGRTSVTVIKRDSLYTFVEGSDAIDVQKLRDFLKRKLEPYKIPNSFFPIPSMPRNTNLKVDTKALIERLP